MIDGSVFATILIVLFIIPAPVLSVLTCPKIKALSPGKTGSSGNSATVQVHEPVTDAIVNGKSPVLVKVYLVHFYDIT